MKLSSKQIKAISAFEIIIAVLAIVFDLLIPTLVVLAVIVLSLLFRKEKLSSLGFKKPNKLLKMVFIVLLLAIVWTIIQFSITLPLLNHLTGTTQNLSSFENLKGNVGTLLYLLFLTWTLAAFGEEIIYRGFLQKRIRDIFGDFKIGIILAVGVSSFLFGLAHLEQGVIGFIVTFIDAIFFSLIKLRFNNNILTSILAHGFNNSIGFVAFFLIGPIYGLW